MGFFSLFRRKKKKKEERELELKQPPPLDYPMQAYPQSPGRQQQPAMPGQSDGDDAEFRVLSSKLDVLNAKLDGITQRLENLERLAGQEEKQKW